VKYVKIVAAIIAHIITLPIRFYWWLRNKIQTKPITKEFIEKLEKD